MRALILGIMLAGQAWGEDLPLAMFPPAPNVSATALFEETMLLHFEDARTCMAVRVPSEKLVRREVRAMVQAVDRFWNGQEFSLYWMACLMLSEGGGFMRNTAKPGEPSFGPWCATVDEARMVSRLFGLDCPKRRKDIEDRLQEDLGWSAMVAAATLVCYDERAEGDRVRGLMIYKHGLKRLSELLEDGTTMTSLKEWERFERRLRRISCLRSRILTGTARPLCGCRVD